MTLSAHSSTSSSCAGSLSGFPEEDLRERSGYFPAWLGQSLLGGKYVIVRKLGWGQHSSVWLARDKEFVHDSEPCQHFL
jgi:serine/threonine-protein kinase SRPK3